MYRCAGWEHILWSVIKTFGSHFRDCGEIFHQRALYTPLFTASRQPSQDMHTARQCEWLSMIHTCTTKATLLLQHCYRGSWSTSHWTCTHTTYSISTSQLMQKLQVYMKTCRGLLCQLMGYAPGLMSLMKAAAIVAVVPCMCITMTSPTRSDRHITCTSNGRYTLLETPCHHVTMHSGQFTVLIVDVCTHAHTLSFLLTFIQYL